MKKLTIEQLEDSFKEDAQQWQWSIEAYEHEFVVHQHNNGYEEVMTFESWVAGSGSAVNSEQGLSVGFFWVANGGRDNYSAAHDFTIELDDNADIQIAGFEFIDGEGDELSISELRSELHELLDAREWCSLVYDELPKLGVEEIDNDNDAGDEMEVFEVIRDNDRNLKFKGECIASASSSANQAMGSSYSGSVGRWTELRLYKTASGKYICSSIGRTQWQGEHDRHSGAICETQSKVVDFFGNGWLAKDLYEAAGIDSSIEIE